MKTKCHMSAVFRWQGTVLAQIWWKILIMIIYASLIVYLQYYVRYRNLKMPLSFLPVLGIVTGMLLVFRTNTAYDRYWEGRRIWGQLNQHSRNLSRSIWLGVEEKEIESEDKIIKKSFALNLVIAFILATKKYLRKDYCRNKQDLVDLVGHLLNFPVDGSKKKKMETNGDYQTVKVDLNINQDTLDCPIELMTHDFVPPSNIPIEISLHLFNYVKMVNKNCLADSSTVSSMYSSISSLVECLTGCERIQRSPMPKAYKIHLHQIVWLYLLLLPYQYLDSLGWWTVGAEAFASFAFLGILALGWEIEEPFGTDHNDLPLDDYCNVMKREVELLMSNFPSSTSTRKSHTVHSESDNKAPGQEEI